MKVSSLKLVYTEMGLTSPSFVLLFELSMTEYAN